LRVSVEDVDIYGYVTFQSLKQAIRGKDEAELGQMSHVAFVHRFSKQPFSSAFGATTTEDRLNCQLHHVSAFDSNEWQK